MADNSEADHLLGRFNAESSYGAHGGGEQLPPDVADDIAGATNGDISWQSAWVWLIVAIVLEVAGTTSMKLSSGLTKLLPSILIYVLYAASFSVFPFALKRIELSTAYAVWSGLGTTLTALIGVVYFSDTMNWIKALSLIAIVGGCVLIKFSDEIEKTIEEESENR
jgi:small multidrug resistance pump